MNSFAVGERLRALAAHEYAALHARQCSEKRPPVHFGFRHKRYRPNRRQDGNIQPAGVVRCHQYTAPYWSTYNGDTDAEQMANEAVIAVGQSPPLRQAQFDRDPLHRQQRKGNDGKNDKNAERAKVGHPSSLTAPFSARPWERRKVPADDPPARNPIPRRLAAAAFLSRH